MKHISVDSLVAGGLVLIGILSIIGYYVKGYGTGTEIPMAIVSGLTGYLGRGATEKHKEGDANSEQ